MRLPQKMATLGSSDGEVMNSAFLLNLVGFTYKAAAERAECFVSNQMNKACCVYKAHQFLDKTHRKFVSKQPCLICGRQPADAHHLRFAQHRALGRKVSDEFIVPLCRGHHREVHRSGDEASWWSKAGIDCISTAPGRFGPKHTRSCRLPNPRTLIHPTASPAATSDSTPVLRLPNATRNRKTKPITAANAQ